MSFTCGTMSTVTLSCTDPALPGTFGDVLLIPKDVYDTATVTQSGGIITNIVLTGVGDVAYNVGLQDSMSVAGFTPTAGESGRKGLYLHEVSVMLDDRSQTMAQLHQALSTGRFVAIVRLKGGTAAAQFIVLGTNSGLTNEDGGFSSAENNGMILATLRNSTTPVQEYEVAPPKTLWPGTLAQAEALITALQVPVPPL
jgi:hypothetical protein